MCELCIGSSISEWDAFDSDPGTLAVFADGTPESQDIKDSLQAVIDQVMFNSGQSRRSVVCNPRAAT